MFRALILMGLRGSGKSTIGRVLGARVGGVCLEVDALVAERLGVRDAGEAFARVGEAGFREAEVEVLGAVLDGIESEGGRGADRVIVSLGGGTPTAPGASELLRRARDSIGILLVYLHADVGVLSERLREVGEDGNRPSLTGKGVVEEIGEVYASRDGLYRELASAVIEVGGESVDGAVEAVRAYWVTDAEGGTGLS